MKKIIFTTLLLLSFSASSQENGAENGAIYECNSEELSNYIKKHTQSLRSPSPLPQGDQVQNSILDERAANAEETGACVGVFSMDMPEIDFSGILDGLPNFDSLSMSAAKKAISELREKLAEQFCESIDSWGGEAKRAFEQQVRSNYGVDFNDISGSSTYELNRKIDNNLYDKYGSDSRYFRDPERFGDDEKRETDRKVREKVRDLWN